MTPTKVAEIIVWPVWLSTLRKLMANVRAKMSTALCYQIALCPRTLVETE